MKDKVGEYEIKKGKPLPLGVSERSRGVQFSVSVPDGRECRLHLYEKKGKKHYGTVIMDEAFRTGSVFSVLIENFPYQKFEYEYEAEGKVFLDPYALLINGRESFGGRWKPERVRGGFCLEKFEWGEDQNPVIPFSESVLYQLHVRGFTKHASSHTAHPGTFAGIAEKIPYLKELGVTALLVLPCYEFNERMESCGGEEAGKAAPSYRPAIPEEPADTRLNYWGYGGRCNYFAPKKSYCFDKEEPIRELKNLIRMLHKNNMEFLMEFYFEEGTNQTLIIDCLRYWAIQYHVDGFKMNDNVAELKTVATDPVLSRTKLLTAYWDTGRIYRERKNPVFKNLADFNDGFLVDARRFLKSDENQVGNFIERLKKNRRDCAVINYIADINGFTLMDLVSYDVKHNEKNGENGRDGTQYNYSWNCGVEGKTRRKAVLALRKKQRKNALAMTFLSQGTPMLLAGDEFGNTSNGNNNPYCQDNIISWLDWTKLDRNRELFCYVRDLISFRKTHPIFHMPSEFHVMDYTSCGYPDISFHGIKAWYPDMTNYSRVLGVMLCGKYAKPEDKFFYLAFNMHWEDHEFALPKLPAGLSWELALDTSGAESFLGKSSGEGRADAPADLENRVTGKRYLVPSRTIRVFISVLRQAE